jgi:hypothetical protein
MNVEAHLRIIINQLLESVCLYANNVVSKKVRPSSIKLFKFCLNMFFFKKMMSDVVKNGSDNPISLSLI